MRRWFPKRAGVVGWVVAAVLVVSAVGCGLEPWGDAERRDELRGMVGARRVEAIQAMVEEHPSVLSGEPASYALASATCDPEMMQVLVDMGFDVRAVDRHGFGVVNGMFDSASRQGPLVVSGFYDPCEDGESLAASLRIVLGGGASVCLLPGGEDARRPVDAVRDWNLSPEVIKLVEGAVGNCE